MHLKRRLEYDSAVVGPEISILFVIKSFMRSLYTILHCYLKDFEVSLKAEPLVTSRFMSV